MHASNTLVALAALNGLPVTGAGHESTTRAQASDWLICAAIYELFLGASVQV